MFQQWFIYSVIYLRIYLYTSVQCLFIYLFISLSEHLFVYFVFIYQVYLFIIFISFIYFIYLFIYLLYHFIRYIYFIYLFTKRSVKFIYLFIYSVKLYIYLFIVCLFVYLLSAVIWRNCIRQGQALVVKLWSKLPFVCFFWYTDAFFFF